MNFNAIMGNWRTSAAGFVAAVVMYLNEAGANLPTDSNGLRSLALAAAIQWLGAMAKDSATGSQPK